jgi:hypothetical protein
MVAFWAEMEVAYLEINKLPCLHEIDIPKCINVYSIYRTKLGVIGFFVLSLEFVGKSTNYTKVRVIHCLSTTLHKTILGFADIGSMEVSFLLYKSLLGFSFSFC